MARPQLTDIGIVVGNGVQNINMPGCGANRETGGADLSGQKTDPPSTAISRVRRLGECFGTPGVRVRRPISGRIF
jgi:hypothetical protein